MGDWLTIYIKGVFMGAADTVPGVSGGTIALITGIYERLVSAIASLDVGLVQALLGMGDEPGRLSFREAADRIDLPFLMVLGLGILTAILTVSRLVAFGLEEFRAPTNAFFFGLIAASALVLYGEVRIDTGRRVVAAILAAVAAFLLTGATASGGVAHGLPVVFVTGTITSSAMLLPGISGAALLYVLGQYEFMVGSLHRFVGAISSLAISGEGGEIMASGAIVITFLTGVGLGLLTVAHAVRWALRRDRATTLTVLVSLMVGALRLPAHEVIAYTHRWDVAAILGLGAAGAAGAGLVLLLDRYTEDLDYDVG